MSDKLRAMLAAVLMSAAGIGLAVAGTPIVDPPKKLVPFGSQPASGALYFGPGQTATVIGKFFSSAATSGSVIHCNGCAGVNIQNSDFDVPNTQAIFIENAGTPSNPIPVVILHTRHKNPASAITLSNVTAAPSSTITHNMGRGLTSRYQHFIALVNNTTGLPPSYCTAKGLSGANCVLKLWYNHFDGRDLTTNAPPSYPAGSRGILIGTGATLPTTGYITTIYNTLVYAGEVPQEVKGGTNVVMYYNKYLQTPGASGAQESLRISKDPASVIGSGFVPPDIDVCYFVQIDAFGYVKAITDDGSMGSSTYESNVGEDVFLDGDLNSTVAPE